MKEAKDCNSIEEIRQCIDNLDQEILRLLGKRFTFVKEIVKYKNKDQDSIIAQKRYDEVIAKRREWARENDLDPGVIAEMYKNLLNHFITEEIKIIENK